MLMSSMFIAIVLLAADLSSAHCYYDLKVTIVKRSQLMPATIVKRRLIAKVPFCSSVRLIHLLFYFLM
jgi:hypothetical protein